MLPGHQDSFGLVYSSCFIDSLPLSPKSSHIRILSAKSFADLHLHHTLSHPPDSVLFPFLHGLEGDNHAQNAFFHSSAIGSPTKSYGSPTTVNVNYAARVPKYRGLAWVICEEDLQLDGNEAALCVLRRRPPSDTDSENESEEYSETSSSFDDEEIPDEDISDMQDRGMPVVVSANEMPLDDPVHEEGESMTMPLSEGKHMHPIQHRPTIKTSGLTFPQPIPISTPSMSTESDSCTSSSSSSSASGASYFAPSTTTSVTSVECSPQSEIPTNPLPSQPRSEPSGPSDGTTEVAQPPPHPEPPNTVPSYKANPTFSPPLLTSTFRPKELLRKVESKSRDRKSRSERRDDSDSENEGEWEFVPARVPDGISLRNFGIQVPIYATLCDIVVYSPKGSTKRALALAERFRSAIERKRKERIQKHVAARMALQRPELRTLPSFYGEESMATSIDGSPAGQPPTADTAARIEAELEKDFLHYNVFVLSANEEEMRREMPHLVMRVAINPESSVSAGWEVGSGHIRLGGGAHTDRSDGHVIEQGNGTDFGAPVRDTSSQTGDMGMDLDMEIDVVKPTDDMENDDVPNTVDFAQREKDEMRDLTRASEILSFFPDGEDFEDDAPRDLSGTRLADHWDPLVGQVFLGNANDVPLVIEQAVRLAHVPQANVHPAAVQDGATLPDEIDSDSEGKEDDPFFYQSSNDPNAGHGYDVCIECHDLAPFPGASHLRAAEEHLAMLDKLWVERCKSKLEKKKQGSGNEDQTEFALPPRPPPNAAAVVHLPCPSSPSNTQTTMAALIPLIKFLEKCIRPLEAPRTICLCEPNATPPSPKQGASSTSPSGRRWSSAGSSVFSGLASAVRTRSFTTIHPPSAYSTNQPQDLRSRPLKVLIYSADGYTESSVLALCLLMAGRGLSLPEVYLELQTVKRRSFFVYQSDLGLLKRVENRLRDDRDREHMQRRPEVEHERWLANGGTHGWGVGWSMSDMAVAGIRYATGTSTQHHGGRAAAKSVSFAQSPLQQYHHATSIEVSRSAGEPASVPPMYMGPPISCSVPAEEGSRTTRKGRPRANTSPWLPSLIGDHQSWFSDPRFDGSFPSRVLPFLYLGNLNHALNAYMLHALGITHVVSVGECALVPPSHGSAGQGRSGSGAQYATGRGPGGHGSLWMEEREGRIKVLDIKGVCDDGIDTLEPQLGPICDWIDKARQEGGKVLVHCRVGVSRSATVTIAYVMKHLGISLVDAYLIVRSRRLSVLIQPNMRLLYNLCGWEIKLAKERAQDDEQKLKRALARTLNWPYLAKEVHALNEKYLR